MNLAQTIPTIVDYFVNRRWLMTVAGLTTVAGVATEIAEAITDTAIQVEGVGLWQALPVLGALVGQLRANSNRYVGQIADAFDDPTEQDL